MFPPYPDGILAGVAPGAAMLPCAVGEGASPAHFSGMATGVLTGVGSASGAVPAPTSLVHQVRRLDMDQHLDDLGVRAADRPLHFARNIVPFPDR